jgi:hypothetical protein
LALGGRVYYLKGAKGRKAFFFEKRSKKAFYISGCGKFPAMARI